jgi:hypothetical protein
VELEKEKKAFMESAAEKDVTLRKKVSTIGNLVHDTVPVNDNEVCSPRDILRRLSNRVLGLQCSAERMGPRGC